MFFNPEYEVLEVLNTHFWTFFEYLAPLIEVEGILVTVYLIIHNLISWPLFILLGLLVYMISVTISFLALFTEKCTYSLFHRSRDLKRLIFSALLEPFIFHPITLFATIQGNWEKLR